VRRLVDDEAADGDLALVVGGRLLDRAGGPRTAQTT
jgi:hypothetical protein